MLRNVLFSCCLIAGAAQAHVVATFTQRTNDVLLELSGSLDRALLGTNFASGNASLTSGFGNPSIRVGPGGAGPAETYFLNDFYPLGIKPQNSVGTYVSGPAVGFFDNGVGDQIRLESAYVSGSTLLSSATFAGSFASLGINSLNQRVANITGTGPGAGTQTLTINFVTAPVPEPQSLALMLAGLGAVALVCKRRRS